MATGGRNPVEGEAADIRKIEGDEKRLVEIGQRHRRSGKIDRVLKGHVEPKEQLSGRLVPVDLESLRRGERNLFVPDLDEGIERPFGDRLANLFADRGEFVLIELAVRIGVEIRNDAGGEQFVHRPVIRQSRQLAVPVAAYRHCRIDEDMRMA